MKRPHFIGVIGGRKASTEHKKIAFEVGKLIAERGAFLVCGGLTGVMEAASKGARASGGQVIGILPGINRSDANRYVDIPIATGIGYARNTIIVHTADAFIAVAGRHGTLSEIAFILHYRKPLIGIDTWDINEFPKAKTAKEAVTKIFKRLTK